MSASAAPDSGAEQPRAVSLPPRQKLQTRAGILEYAVSGQGPSIVLLNGAGVTIDSWRTLYPAIEQIGTVFSWNRFGVTGSDGPQRAQNGALVIASVRELMAYAGLQPPYVLVGHSLGGLYANLFARMHPREIAAVLFLEATHPRDHALLREHEDQLARALSNVFSLPQRLFRDNLHAEIESAAQTAEEVEAAGSFPEIPVAVISGAAAPPKSLMSPAAVLTKRVHQEELARLSSQGEHVIAGRSGHFPQASEPGLVLEVLRRLVRRAHG
jgi:pimeloyl-ACP methyl ester carboxylesterase